MATTEFKSDSSSKRVLKNGAYTAVRFAVFSLSGFFLIPFLLKEYGRESYGLIALAGFLTQYVGLISGCVGNSIARYLNIALNKNDWQQANEIFNTAIVSNVAAIILQVPVFALGVWKLDWLIDFPPELAHDFKILVICNIALFFLNIMKGVFFTPIQAANRLDISEKFNMVAQVLRLILIFSLILGIGPKLWVIGAVDLGVGLIIFAAGILIYRRLVDRSLVFDRKYITAKWVKPVLNMAGWSLVSALGFALFVKTDVWIINRFVSKEMAGVYAALLVWPNFIKQAGEQVSSLIAPVYMIDYAKNDFMRIKEVCLFVHMLLGLFAAVAAGFIFIFSESILQLWLGVEFTDSAPLLKLMTVGTSLTLGSLVVWGIFPAIDKTHYSGITNLATGLLNIVLSIWFVYLGYGVYGVAVGTLISTILKSAIILPYGVAREFGFSFGRFAANHLVSLSVLAGLIYLNQLLLLASFGQLWVRVCWFGLSCLILVPVAFLLGCSKAQRSRLVEVVHMIQTKIRPEARGK